jgi:Pycsar effector protein
MWRRQQRAAEARRIAPWPSNEFGWRTHEAIQGWTASVDVKSSIVVVIETAVAGAAAKSLITEAGELHSASGLHLATAVSAMTTLVLAVACALWVVFPRLERKGTSTHTGLVYFGHLRARSPEDIAAALEKMTLDEERLQLAQQLHVTGNVAWRKHAWLQASLGLFAVGSALLVLAFVAF